MLALNKHNRPTGFRYKIFRLWWMWKNRNWTDTRQKRKALEKEWRKHEKNKT